MNSYKNNIVICLFFILFSSCGKIPGTNKKIPGVKNLKLKILKELEVLQILGEIEVEYKKNDKYIKIPKLSSSYLKIFAATETKNTSLELNLNIPELISLSPDSFDPSTLPGGRSIPGISTGKLPSIAITVPVLKNVAFYIGYDVFGLFIPVPKLNEKKAITTARFRLNGKRVGNISIVGGDQNKQNGGILLLIDLDQAQKDLLYNLYLK